MFRQKIVSIIRSKCLRLRAGVGIGSSIKLSVNERNCFIDVYRDNEAAKIGQRIEKNRMQMCAFCCLKGWRLESSYELFYCHILCTVPSFLKLSPLC